MHINVYTENTKTIFPAKKLNAGGRKLIFVNEDKTGRLRLNELQLFQLLRRGFAPIPTKEIRGVVYEHKLNGGQGAIEIFGGIYAFSGREPFTETAYSTCGDSSLHLAITMDIPPEYRGKPFSFLLLERFFESGKRLVKVGITCDRIYKIPVYDERQYMKLRAAINDPGSFSSDPEHIRQMILKVLGNGKTLPMPTMTQTKYQISLTLAKEAMNYLSFTEFPELKAGDCQGMTCKSTEQSIGFLKTLFPGKGQRTSFGREAGYPLTAGALLEKLA